MKQLQFKWIFLCVFEHWMEIITGQMEKNCRLYENYLSLSTESKDYRSNENKYRLNTTNHRLTRKNHRLNEEVRGSMKKNYRLTENVVVPSIGWK